MLTAYRIVYGFVLAVFLGNLVMTIYLGMNPPQVSALLFAAAVSLCCIFVLLVGFSHVRPAVFWGLVLLWEALFVWYAWFSPAAPFVLHEIHTFEANAAAREITAHYLKGGALFALLFAWFLSLPIARLRYHRRPAAHV